MLVFKKYIYIYIYISIKICYTLLTRHALSLICIIQPTTRSRLEYAPTSIL